jgi:hypothetical protein
MQPTVRRLEATYADRVVFTSLDIDDPGNTEFEMTLGFRSQPTFLLLDGQGAVLQRWLGPAEEAEFAAAIDAALK